MDRRVAIALGMVCLIAGCLLVGCGGSSNETLAVVGDYEVGSQEFEDFYGNPGLTFATAQEEYDHKRMWLDSLVVTRLLVESAYEKNIDQREELARILLANRDKFLLDVLYQEHISAGSEPSEAEIKAHWNNLADRVRASHILLDNMDTAQAVFERVKAGENFEQLAYEYSIDPSAKRNRGDLGYFTWGRMVPEFQEAAFNMEPGEVSPPVESQFGYHIIKVVDRLPNEQRGSYEEMKPMIEQQLRRTAEMKAMEAYLADIKARNEVTVDTSVFQYLLHKREQMYPPQILESLPSNDFDLGQLDGNEKELVAATWDGGQITVNEYFTLAKNISPQMKPDLNDFDSLATIIFELKKLDMLVAEAYREGLDNNETYLRRVKLFKELNMAEMMRNDSIAPPLQPTDAMLREYYDAHPEEFTNPAKIHLHEILISDKGQAERLVKEITGFSTFTQKASELTERPGKRAADGDLGWVERTWNPEAWDRAWEVETGRVIGPFEMSGRYSVLYVKEKQNSQLKDFLGQKRIIVQKLQTEQRNHAFQSWVNERKKNTRIVVNDDALWSLIDTDKYGPVGGDAG